MRLALNIADLEAAARARLVKGVYAYQEREVEDDVCLREHCRLPQADTSATRPARRVAHRHDNASAGRTGKRADGVVSNHGNRSMDCSRPAADALPDRLLSRPVRPVRSSSAECQARVRDGLPEKIVMACLLHDIAVFGLIRADHGYWGAQLIEPYVDEEVSWTVRAHQALRFYPDKAAGYKYPEQYVRMFGADYRPDAYIDRDYQEARKHRWYMMARLVTLYDFYAFDPDTIVDIEEFTDIIGRNFRQPEEGLGVDSNPSSHMRRTIIAPKRFL